VRGGIGIALAGAVANPRRAKAHPTSKVRTIESPELKFDTESLNRIAGSAVKPLTFM
jgi:hypothetical protein